MGEFMAVSFRKEKKKKEENVFMVVCNDFFPLLSFWV